MIITREEQRAIRQQIQDMLDYECAGCPFRRGRPTHCRKKCQVGSQLKHLSWRLVQSDVEEEKTLEISRVYGQWTEEEDFYLIHHMNYFDIYHLSKKLNRAPGQISKRFNKLMNERRELYGV